MMIVRCNICEKTLECPTGQEHALWYERRTLSSHYLAHYCSKECFDKAIPVPLDVLND